MSETLIANNCIGGSILHDLGLKFNTPTINLQILPAEFPKFCKNLRHYMETELVEYKEPSNLHKYELINMFGHTPKGEFPYGLCDDIIICFQHYPTFADAKAAWDRRKERIDYNHIGFLFYLAWDFDQKRALEFADLGLKHATIFTERFDIGIPHFRVDPPEGAHFLDIAPNGKKYYEQEFNPISYIETIRRD